MLSGNSAASFDEKKNEKEKEKCVGRLGGRSRNRNKEKKEDEGDVFWGRDWEGYWTVCNCVCVNVMLEK